MTEPLTEYARHNTCRHGVIASRCQECIRNNQELPLSEIDHNKFHYTTLPIEVAQDSSLDIGENNSAEPGYRIVRIKDTVMETVKCRHDEIPGECGQCLYEQKEAMSNKVNMPGILTAATQELHCFHGIPNEQCEQCKAIAERKQGTISPPQYTRHNDVKQHVIGLLKIITNMLEEL